MKPAHASWLSFFLSVTLSLSHWYPGSGVVLDLSIPDLCLLSYLHSTISNETVSTKIYNKHEDFDFKIVNFIFIDGVVPRSTSYGAYISILIRFAIASNHVADFDTCNQLLTS